MQPGTQRPIDESIHPEVQKFFQEVTTMKKKLEEYHQMNAKKNAPGATDALKSNVNMRLRTDVKVVDENLRNLYTKVAMFEDNLKKYSLLPQNIQLFKQTLNNLDRFKKAIFAEACGQSQTNLRGGTVTIARNVETEAQRNMTTTQIVDNTDEVLNMQNQTIEAIGRAVHNTNIAAQAMGDQLDVSNQRLSDLNTEMHYANQNIVERTDQMNKISKMSKKNKTCLMGAINAVLALALGLMLYFGITSNQKPKDDNTGGTTE